MKRITVGIVLLVALVLAPLVAQDFEVELQRAIQQESVSGDLNAAIQEYRRIAEAARDRAIKARALLRLADAHRKLGNAEARSIYERIVKEYADQKEQVEVASENLRAIATGRPSAAARVARQIWVSADATGMPSDDGRLLGYTDWTTGDLMVRDLAAGTSRRLTNTGGWEKSGDFAEFPIISPDQRQIAYAWIIEKPKEAYELRVMPLQADDATPRTVVRSEQHGLYPQAWTPDGQHIIATRPDGKLQEIVVVSTKDGTTRVLTAIAQGRPGPISISPDGRFVSYSFSNGPSRQLDIAILPITGGRPTVMEHPAMEGASFWTPGGDRLLFTSNRTGANALWGVSFANGVVSGRAELVASDIGTIALKLDRTGRFFYVKGGNQRNVLVASVDAASNREREPALVSTRFVNVTGGPAWSPDGRHLAYYADRAPGSIGARAIVVQELATGAERGVMTRFNIPDGNGVGLKWFPDGGSLLAIGRGKPSETTEYYRVDAVTGDARLIHTATGWGAGTTDPQISRDGQTLYYVRGPQMGRRQIVSVDLATGRETPLLEGWFGSIALSPDDRRLAYLGNLQSSSDPNELAVTSTSGAERQVLLPRVDAPAGMRFNTIGWSRDGAFLFFVRSGGATVAGGQQIWRVPLTGGQPESTGIGVQGIIKNPQVSPDGRRLAFGNIRQQPAELWVLENFLPSQAK